MDKWNLIINVDRCENCNNCVLTAKDEFTGNKFPGYSAPVAKEGAELISVTRKIRGESPVIDTAYLVKMCNHCDDAPCMKNAGDAVRKRDDGIVIMDPEKAKGRKDIAKSCPYGAIVWNEEQELPQTWFFDAHLLDSGWTEPRCAQSCPTGVFEPVKTSDANMKRRAEAEGLEVLLPHLNTAPRVYYRNLYRFNKCFVGATVVANIAGVEECLQGAQVELLQGATLMGRAQTDIYGEFKVDKLSPNSGAYQLRIAHPNYRETVVEGVLDSESQYLGVIELSK